MVNNTFRETRFSDSSLLSLLHEFLLGMKPPLTSLLSYPCGSLHPMPSSSRPRPSSACPTSLTLWLPSSLFTLPPSIPLLPAHLSDSPGRYRLRLCCHPPSPPSPSLPSCFIAIPLSIIESVCFSNLINPLWLLDPPCPIPYLDSMFFLPPLPSLPSPKPNLYSALSGLYIPLR